MADDRNRDTDVDRPTDEEMIGRNQDEFDDVDDDMEDDLEDEEAEVEER